MKRFLLINNEPGYLKALEKDYLLNGLYFDSVDDAKAHAYKNENIKKAWIIKTVDYIQYIHNRTFLIDNMLIRYDIRSKILCCITK